MPSLKYWRNMRRGNRSETQHLFEPFQKPGQENYERGYCECTMGEHTTLASFEFTNLVSLMPEAPLTSEYHDNSMAVGCLYHLCITNRSSGLNDGTNTGSSKGFHTIGERKKPI
jgi:hypothetical protein